MFGIVQDPRRTFPTVLRLTRFPFDVFLAEALLAPVAIADVVRTVDQQACSTSIVRHRDALFCGTWTHRPIILE